MGHKVTITEIADQTNVVLTKEKPKEVKLSDAVKRSNVVLTKKVSSKIVPDSNKKGEKGDAGPPGPQGIQGSQGPPGVDGTFTQTEKLALEMQLAFKVANLNNFRELTYSSGSLSNLSIYTDNTKTTKLFDKALSYTNNQLTQVVLTRISDSTVLTKTLVYNLDGTLNTITVN